MNIDICRDLYVIFTLLGCKLRRLGCIIILCICSLLIYLFKWYTIASIIMLISVILVLLGSVLDLIACYFSYKIEKLKG